MKYIILIALLTGCGTEEPTDTKAPLAPTGGIAYQPESPKEVVIEYRKDGDSISITVSNTSELPACERANSGQTAWVKTTGQSFSCNNEAWVEIPKKEPEAESQVEITPKGGSEIQAKQAPGNQWDDPITDQSWVLGIPVTEVGLASITPCTGEWRLPTRAETKTAIQHGLPVEQDSTWTGEFSSTSARVSIDPNGLSESTGLNKAGIACVKVAP